MSNTNTEKQAEVVLFQDHIGRNIIAEEVSFSGDALVVNDPVVLSIEPNQNTGKLSVNFYPLVFPEFLEEGESNTWTYNAKSIVISLAAPSKNFVERYMLITKKATPPEENDSAPKVISIKDL